MLAHIVQVHGEGEDKADFGQLGGLKAQRAEQNPAVVIGVSGRISQFDGPDGESGQGEQHKPPCDGHMHRPDLSQAPVVDTGEHHRTEQSQQAGCRLHHRIPVIAQAGNLAGERIHSKAAVVHADADEGDHTEGGAAHAQQKIKPVGGFYILTNDLEHSMAPSVFAFVFSYYSPVEGS